MLKIICEIYVQNMGPADNAYSITTVDQRNLRARTELLTNRRNIIYEIFHSHMYNTAVISVIAVNMLHPQYKYNSVNKVTKSIQDTTMCEKVSNIAMQQREY